MRMLLWGDGVLSEGAIVHVGLLEARQVGYVCGCNSVSFAL